MVIWVLERRGEIGLRRALGATETHIRVQFFTEALLLSLLGGAVGVAATAVYATLHGWGWAIVVPAMAWAGGASEPRSPPTPASTALRRPHVSHGGTGPFEEREGVWGAHLVLGIPHRGPAPGAVVS